MMPEGAHKVRVVRAGELRPGQPTAGMVREEAFATGSLWAGLVRTEPGMRSGWHHHGSHQTAIYVLSGRLRMESGPGGSEVAEAGPGDFIHVPADAVHRESNPAAEQAVAVILRSGTGEVVVNVERPEP
jgi:uncharacterized RmlC-like cupin family protein